MLAVGATAVYLITLEPTTSFWDCGEFIAVSYQLQVGHPPGAPFYQLLAHLFTLLAGGNAAAVAWWSNALSAVAGGCTVMFLYWTIRLLQRFSAAHNQPHIINYHFAAAVGSLCYLFCDTAWFSAVESEVYSLAMLIASVVVWAMLRWYHTPDHTQAQRWLMLVALMLGLGACTHLLTLLTLPAVPLLFIFKTKNCKQKSGRVKHVAHRKETFYLLKGDPRPPSVGFASENIFGLPVGPFGGSTGQFLRHFLSSRYCAWIYGKTSSRFSRGLRSTSWDDGHGKTVEACLALHEMDLKP